MSTTDTAPHRSAAVRPAWFTAYKGVNSLFTGLSVGAVFTLYAPLDPEVFSAGGIGLAIGMLLVATQYERLLNVRWFFAIAMLVEIIMLAAIAIILAWRISAATALAVYLGYQVTFVFGGYLVRCETLLIAEGRWLKRLDIAKQAGYLLGMGAAWAFYQGAEHLMGVADKTEQVVQLHSILLLTEVLVIALLWQARGKDVLGASGADRNA